MSLPRRRLVAMPPRLAPPPRAVPLTLRLVTILGGALPLVAWILIGVGMLLTTLLLQNAEPLFGDRFADAVRVRGRVTSVDATNTRVNSRRVHAVHFEWNGADGTHTGTSYGRSALPAVGSEVVVEVTTDAPPLARVQGLSAFLLPAAVNAVLVVPVAGALLLAIAGWRGLRRVRLLRHGQPTTGRLTERRPTNTRVNGRAVEALTFAFTDAAGRPRTTRVRSHRLAALLDDAEEPLLHAPDSDAAALLDEYPARPRWNERGEFEPASFGQLALVLLGPTLVLVVSEIANAIAASFH